MYYLSVDGSVLPSYIFIHRYCANAQWALGIYQTTKTKYTKLKTVSCRGGSDGDCIIETFFFFFILNSVCNV